MSVGLMVTFQTANVKFSKAIYLIVTGFTSTLDTNYLCRHNSISFSCMIFKSHAKNAIKPTIFQRGSFMVWEINMGVCPRFEFDNIMFINCLGYDFYIYGAFKFICNSIANL